MDSRTRVATLLSAKPQAEILCLCHTQYRYRESEASGNVGFTVPPLQLICVRAANPAYSDASDSPHRHKFPVWYMHCRFAHMQEKSQGFPKEMKFFPNNISAKKWECVRKTALAVACLLTWPNLL